MEIFLFVSTDVEILLVYPLVAETVDEVDILFAFGNDDAVLLTFCVNVETFELEFDC